MIASPQALVVCNATFYLKVNAGTAKGQRDGPDYRLRLTKGLRSRATLLIGSVSCSED